MKSKIKGVLAKFGIRSSYDAQRYKQYSELKKKIEQTSSINNSAAAIIIFSKDRALQLDALLSSYFKYTQNSRPIYVLFSVSDKEYEKGYTLLQEKWFNRAIQFIQEKEFKKDLIQLIDSLKINKLCFLVDDILFKTSVDLDPFFEINPKKYVASLRMGEHLNYAYTMQKKQSLPAFKQFNKGQEMISWNFNEAVLDWNYPLSVDGHLFDYSEIKILIEELNYRAPNSFEEALQIMNPLFQKRTGVCYKLSKIVNNPCNKVQEENNNIAGDISVEELNKRWLEGYTIRYEQYEDIKNESAHYELPIEFIKQ